MVESSQLEDQLERRSRPKLQLHGSFVVELSRQQLICLPVPPDDASLSRLGEHFCINEAENVVAAFGTSWVGSYRAIEKNQVTTFSAYQKLRESLLFLQHSCVNW